MILWSIKSGQPSIQIDNLINLIVLNVKTKTLEHINNYTKFLLLFSNSRALDESNEIRFVLINLNKLSTLH